jgi:hypothetical protein
MDRPNPPQTPTTDLAEPVAVHHITGSVPVVVIPGDLGALLPLVDQYQREMASRIEGGFRVDTLREWVTDLVRARRGVCVEDPGAVADRHDDYGQDG